MYDTILLPTDGTAGLDRAFDHAVALAGAFDAELHVLSVLTEAETSAAADVGSLRADRQSVLSSVASAARDDGIETETAIRAGVPHEAILEYVADAGVDLAVMATHGRTGMDRMLLGSVTERVVRSAPVPVVTVRMGDDGSLTADGARRRAREVLEDAGHEGVEVVDDPHRTIATWVVPARTEDGVFNVHLDRSGSDASVARLD